MELENQVVSLELAKKLKELGVKQESLYFWFDLKEELYPRCCKGWVYKKEHMISAFTVAELGEMLPFAIVQDGTIYKPECYIPEGYTDGDGTKISNKFGVTYVNHYMGQTLMYCEANTEADARAKMLCYLLENKMKVVLYSVTALKIGM